MEENFEGFLAQMQQSYEKLAGMRADDASDIGIRFKILAEQLAIFSEELAQVRKQSFVQTADGKYLEMHAQQRGIYRKEATFAKGSVTFSRSSAAVADIEIPSGVYLTCSSFGGTAGLRFVTTEAATLKQGQTSVAVSVQCQAAGSIGNLAAGVLDVMITPVQGITAVKNPNPISSGEDAESDESLRQRLLDSYHNVVNGTNSAFYYHMAMQYPGVSSVKILPRVNGVNTVGIVLYGSGVDDQLIQKVKTEIGQLKEINVDLTVEKATTKPTAVSIQIAVGEGYSYADVSAICEDAVEEYLKKQKIGQPLYPALLVREILNCEGVANCKVVSPSADLYPLEKEVFVLSDCTVSQMERQ